MHRTPRINNVISGASAPADAGVDGTAADGEAFASASAAGCVGTGKDAGPAFTTAFPVVVNANINASFTNLHVWPDAASRLRVWACGSESGDDAGMGADVDDDGAVPPVCTRAKQQFGSSMEEGMARRMELFLRRRKLVTHRNGMHWPLSRGGGGGGDVGFVAASSPLWSDRRCCCCCQPRHCNLQLSRSSSVIGALQSPCIDGERS